MIEFRPESEGDLIRRYEQALLELIDQDDVAAGRHESPGLHRAHVFDFADGLRLIVSRERTPLGVGVHFSASVMQDTDIYRLLVGRQMTAIQFCLQAVLRWQTLARTDVEPDFLGTSPGKKIPHWFLRLDLPTH